MKDLKTELRIGLLVVSICLVALTHNNLSVCRLEAPYHANQTVLVQSHTEGLRGSGNYDFLPELAELDKELDRDRSGSLSNEAHEVDSPPLHDSGTKWPPKQMIDAILQPLIDDGSLATRRLVVAASNSEYVDFADNFANSLIALNVTNFVLVPLDSGAYEALHRAYPQHTLPLMPGMNAVPEGKADFNSPEFKQLTATRPVFLRAFLEQGYTIFYNDIDMVWQHNAWNVIDERDHRGDSMRNSSISNTTAMIWQDGKGADELCTCLLMLHPHQIGMVDQWNEEISKGTKADDQQAFNVVARHLNLPFAGGLTPNGVRIFPNDEQFPPGSRFDWFNANDPQNQRAVIVHNNWVFGKEYKRKRFNAAGLWKPSGRLAPTSGD